MPDLSLHLYRLVAFDSSTITSLSHSPDSIPQQDLAVSLPTPWGWERLSKSSRLLIFSFATLLQSMSSALFLSTPFRIGLQNLIVGFQFTLEKRVWLSSRRHLGPLLDVVPPSTQTLLHNFQFQILAVAPPFPPPLSRQEVLWKGQTLSE